MVMTQPEQTRPMPTRAELENAASEHAVIPFDVRAERSPLMRYLPDDQQTPKEIRDLVEQITGHRCPWGGPIATYVIAAWCRSKLTRWALKQPGVWEARRATADRHIARQAGIPARGAGY